MPEPLHLNPGVGTWTADRLLAIFFFVVGLELKEEFVAGKLRDPRSALVRNRYCRSGVAIPGSDDHRPRLPWYGW